jgi:type II secretory pathway pseudopilin PulG
MTLIELLLSLSITGMVGAAIVAMLGAVSTGAGSRRDNRSAMVQAAAARSRLGAYIAPARCVLGVSGSNLALWLDDSRESGTVHGSEIRWLRFDTATSTVSVSYVRFPDGWSQAAQNLADDEHAAASNWDTVLASYTAQGHIDTLTLMDRVDSVDIQLDDTDAQDARHLIFQLGLATDAGSLIVCVPATVSQHQQPEK